MQLSWKIFVPSYKSSVVFWNSMGWDLQLRCQNQCNFRFFKKTVMFDYFRPVIFCLYYGVISFIAPCVLTKSRKNVCVLLLQINGLLWLDRLQRLESENRSPNHHLDKMSSSTLIAFNDWQNKFSLNILWKLIGHTLPLILFGMKNKLKVQLHL